MQQVEPKALTVSQLNASIQDLVYCFQKFTVIGEISSAGIRNGYFFCTLKDDQSAIPLVMFDATKKYLPKDGELVTVQGELNYYSKNGKLSIKADSIKKAGLGDMSILLAELKNRLNKKGYFDEAHKKAIPKYPTNVCIITSSQGKAIQDIETTIRNKNQMINLTNIDVMVQGITAAQQICSALQLADRQNFDVIILARGGGSFEDLMPFNDENMAGVIYHMNTPIISAIGHDGDYLISDLVADKRAATPTAAAELIAFDSRQLRIDIIKDIRNIYTKLKLSFDAQLSKVTSYATSVFYSAKNKLTITQQSIIDTLNKIYTDTLFYIDKNEIDVSTINTKLKETHPRSLLKQGYFKVLCNNKTISNIKHLKSGNKISLYSTDGIVKATVNEIIILKGKEQ
ncbi:MAG: exodeoxyribonuclease VII large subunit [Christensenellaceae bacterium]|jgi:exodeoxyribonuclease VII large subunit|nr:exodeoxyribonuclease VII large subunit [Christensenellaceae bacterium]